MKLVSQYLKNKIQNQTSHNMGKIYQKEVFYTLYMYLKKNLKKKKWNCLSLLPKMP